MPAVPPAGPDSPGGSPLKDEAALERLFRAHYSALIKAAQANLKDTPEAAPRVVEGLFLAAWKDRDQFTSAKDLDDFLDGEIAHASARELSRRASAHHLGGGKATARHADRPVDVEQSWQHIHRVLHPDASAAASAIAEQTKHGAASHVKGLAKRRSWKIPIIIGIVAIVVAGAVTLYLNEASREGSVIAALKASGARQHVTGPGQFVVVGLDNGTQIFEGPESRVVVPEKYGPGLRVVALAGVGLVTATSASPDDPFEVRAAAAVIDAPSAVMVIRADTTDSVVTILVRTGNASVRVGKEIRPLAAGQALTVAANGQMSTPDSTHLAVATSWADSTVTIPPMPLSHGLDELRRWYGVKIVVLDSALLTRQVSASASINNSLAAIQEFEKAADLKFGYEGQTMVFTDAKKK
jgi:ferric-dicitrate binding protein FerR (iron transport regulator)